MSASFSVIVGNIGTVYAGESEQEARTVFAEYVTQSKCPGGFRASGEEVTLMRDGEPVEEHNAS